MDQARAGQSSGSILLIDLDNLKTVNDTLGHAYGDAIIVEAAKRIKLQAGENAFVGRISGDEFIVVLPECSDRRDSAVIADRLIKSFCQETEVLGEILHLSISVGVAHYPEDGDTVDEILKSVDKAMYFAKQSGKNCWNFYDKDMQAAYK